MNPDTPFGPQGLTQIIEGNPVATLVIDAGHRVTHWNRACAILTGVEAAEMLGTQEQWRPFYPKPRPIMADLIVDGAMESAVDQFYGGKFRRSGVIDGAFEAEDHFPHLGADGRWLFFTAAALKDETGRTIGAIETLQDITARHRAEAALKESEERYRELSRTDALTGLYNSRHLQECLLQEVERARRHASPLSLLVLDADHFKRINDTHGHLEGDRVLQALARTIGNNQRRSDLAFRYGGEEFVLLLPQTTGAEALVLAERLRREFAAQEVVPEQGEVIRCTISIGVSQYQPGESPRDFIRRADAATYAAKARGRNCVVGAD
ncbi:sensor domain-containing diguanylate cyclase [Azovibrio restrictus]|uniref:sensor domain-containing diguanylate cyclase n=1 Tax=Azovibrio restrictus TaxID=146938 RepID=UPI0026EC6BA4|nr:sensor domain-containing diguanylate cyclase [Azovibrio restrictus]MDD3483708.1 diguanylate cyclase [Azovibrio restrictus]